jgi:Phage Terminase
MNDQAEPVLQLDESRTALIERMLDLMVWLDGRKLADVLMPFQTGILKEFLGTVRVEDLALWYKRGLVHIGKKNAKTLLLILSSMILLHTDKPLGRKGCQIIYVASDENQADENLDFTKKLYRVNPLLLDEVQIKNSIIELKSGGGYIEIVAAKNADSLHGRSYRLLAFDELHTQVDYRVLEALEIDPTRWDAQQLFASYSPLTPKPGTPIVDMLAQARDRLDPRLFVFSRCGSIEEANPGLGGPLGSTKEEIESARFRLPTWHWRRLYLNLPGQGADSAYDAAAIEACVVKGRRSLPPQPGVNYVGFVDMSGGGSDDSTLAIAHGDEQGLAVLDLVMDQGPRTSGTFSPAQAVSRFVEVLKLYRCHSVTGDNFAKNWPRDEFAKFGVHYEAADRNRSELYATLEPRINAGTVELLDSDKLIAQLISLVRRGIKINHQNGEHDDWANVAAGVLTTVATQQAQGEPFMWNFVTGEPIYSADEQLLRREAYLRGVDAEMLRTQYEAMR